MKASIKCHETEAWTQILPLILLGIRAAWKEDLNSTPAQMVYGESIRLPGQFLSELNREYKNEDTLVTRLRRTMAHLRPKIKQHGQKTTFIFKDMDTASHVFVRHDAPAGALHLPYDGSYEVLNRGNRTFKLRVRGKTVNIAVDRLKPAYIMDEAPDQAASQAKPSTEATTKTTKSGRTVRQPVQFAPT